MKDEEFENQIIINAETIKKMCKKLQVFDDTTKMSIHTLFEEVEHIRKNIPDIFIEALEMAIKPINERLDALAELFLALYKKYEELKGSKNEETCRRDEKEGSSSKKSGEKT